MEHHHCSQCLCLRNGTRKSFDCEQYRLGCALTAQLQAQIHRIIPAINDHGPLKMLYHYTAPLVRRTLSTFRSVAHFVRFILFEFFSATVTGGCGAVAYDYLKCIQYTYTHIHYTPLSARSNKLRTNILHPLVCVRLSTNFLR